MKLPNNWQLQSGAQSPRSRALSTPSKLMLAAVLLFSLLGVLTKTGAQEAYQEAHSVNERRTLTGNWLVKVTRANPAPGQSPSFLSLMTYFKDGNFLEESNSNSVRSTGRGYWERTGPREFTRSMSFFRFDAARNYIGLGRNTATVWLSEDGNEFYAEAVTSLYDTAENLTTTAQITEVGERQ